MTRPTDSSGDQHTPRLDPNAPFVGGETLGDALARYGAIGAPLPPGDESAADDVRAWYRALIHPATRPEDRRMYRDLIRLAADTALASREEDDRAAGFVPAVMTVEPSSFRRDLDSWQRERKGAR